MISHIRLYRSPAERISPNVYHRQCRIRRELVASTCMIMWRSIRSIPQHLCLQLCLDSEMIRQHHLNIILSTRNSLNHHNKFPSAILDSIPSTGQVSFTGMRPKTLDLLPRSPVWIISSSASRTASVSLWIASVTGTRTATTTPMRRSRVAT